jgi:signal transduction histidine kinase
LILDQSDISGPLFHQIFSALTDALHNDPGSPVTVYFESLDLSRFTGSDYDESLQRHLQVKYRDKPIGVLVPIGATALADVLRWRAHLWSGVPVVFAQVDEGAFARLKPPPDVTGVIVKLRLADMITSARAVVADLKRVAFVGDAWESQTAYRDWKEEIPVATAGLEVIDLIGLPMRELRERVSVLPDQTAILYSAIYSDGEGTFYPPVQALALLAEKANRPIVVSVETFLGNGGIGGFALEPSLIGQSAARLALRVIDGESAAAIPPAPGDLVRPVFDWRQMQRWGVSAARLPPGSEIRFRDPTAWDRYKVQILAIFGALLLQGTLITWLLHERQYRRRAEAKAHDALAELTQMNRISGAGELAASIAHEINQPLTGIVARAGAARRWLAMETPNIDKVRASLDDIESAGHRAGEIIKNVRALFRGDTQDRVAVDLNSLIMQVLTIAQGEIKKHQIAIQTQLDDSLPSVIGNPVQLQQVVLNLVLNALEAMHSAEFRQLRVRSEISKPDMVRVSIEDSGTGIDPSNLDRIFKPLFTTKARGMGMGLSICRSIIEGHNGRIGAGISREGSTFQFELPANVPGSTLARSNAGCDIIRS